MTNRIHSSLCRTKAVKQNKSASIYKNRQASGNDSELSIDDEFFPCTLDEIARRAAADHLEETRQR